MGLILDIGKICRLRRECAFASEEDWCEARLQMFTENGSSDSKRLGRSAGGMTE